MNKGFSNNIAKSIIAERGARIEFMVVRNKKGKENFFYLMLTEAENTKLEEKIRKGETIRPTDHGLVLFQGVGKTPPPEIEKIINYAIEMAERTS